MADRPEDTGHPEERHDKARALGEDALGALSKGDEKKADKLIAEAKSLDPSALEEIVEDLDEDAESDPRSTEKLPD